MKVTAVSGTYAPTLENGFGSYRTVPDEYTKIASFASSTDVTGTSICPSGWRLPYGNISGNGNTSKGFYYLDLAMGGTGATQSSTAGTTQSKIWRSFPNNFLYSGNYNGSSAKYRGSY